MKNSARTGNILIPFLIFAAIVFLGALVFKTELLPTSKSQIQDIQQRTESNGQLKEYTSQDLKISFKYPAGWFVEDEYPFTLISNFKSSLHKDIKLENDQIEIMISEFSNCFPTLEEDLVDPACGQGKQKNKIISKDITQAPGGEFLKYTLDSYDENQRVQYFFQKGDKILDIEKNPDPSQFEKEFDQIAQSFKFLP